MNFLQGKKTLIANVLMILVAALSGLQETQWVSAETMVYIVGIANMLLRLVTTGPVTIR
jgi:hypothetical protein